MAHTQLLTARDRPAATSPARPERERLLAFAFANADILLELDRDLAIVYCAGAVGSLLGRRETSLAGQVLTDLVAAADRAGLAQRLTAVAANRRLPPLGVHLLHADGKASPAVLSGYRLDAPDGGFFLTLSASWPAVEPAAPGASRDAVTGLLDRDGFQERIGNRLRAGALGTTRCAGPDEQLSFLQVQNLDVLEASLGGDGVARVLEEIGTALRVHAVDGESAGRLAPDRFGVLHAGDISFATIDQAARQAAEVATDNRASVSLSGTSLPLETAGMSDDTLLRVLSYAVNRFVEQPPERFGVASLADGMRAMMTETVSRVVALKSTLASKGFTVTLQPIVRLDDRALHHFEMLSRFPETTSPGETVAFAEDTGLVLELDLLVCEHAIGLLKQAEAAGTALRVAVNLSGRSLESDLFLGGLETLLDDAGLDRRGLIFEITESSLIKDLVQANRMVQCFRARGHEVCLDDFGAGAATFSYIRSLAVDYVKIDGGYVRNLRTNPRDRAIVNAIVALCRELDCGTIAEFVELDEQCRLLAGIGVTLGQGFLFGKPSLDGREAMRWAAQSAAAGRNAGARTGAHRRGAQQRWE